jgi:hypothetical protein
VANNEGLSPIVNLRKESTNAPSFRVYQSATSAITSGSTITTGDNLLVGVFNRTLAAGSRLELRINETTASASALDENINNDLATPAGAVGQRGGTIQGTGLTGNFAMAISGTIALSKTYTDMLSRALSTPSSFAVEE